MSGIDFAFTSASDFFVDTLRRASFVRTFTLERADVLDGVFTDGISLRRRVFDRDLFAFGRAADSSSRLDVADRVAHRRATSRETFATFARARAGARAADVLRLFGETSRFLGEALRFFGNDAESFVSRRTDSTAAVLDFFVDALRRASFVRTFTLERADVLDGVFTDGISPRRRVFDRDLFAFGRAADSSSRLDVADRIAG